MVIDILSDGRQLDSSYCGRIPQCSYLFKGSSLAPSSYFSVSQTSLRKAIEKAIGNPEEAIRLIFPISYPVPSTATVPRGSSRCTLQR